MMLPGFPSESRLLCREDSGRVKEDDGEQYSLSDKGRYAKQSAGISESDALQEK